MSSDRFHPHLNSLISQALEHVGINPIGLRPSITFAILEGTRTHIDTWGLSNLNYNSPATDQTPFHLASLAKQICALVILIAENDGRLDLSDHLGRYIKRLPAVISAQKISDLLFHRGGVRDHWALATALGWRAGDRIDTSDVMRLVQNERTLNFEPGARFLYSNTGYVLLAELAAHLYKTPFDTLARQLVFAPANMPTASFHLSFGVPMLNRIVGYQLSSTDDQWTERDPPYAVAGATCLRASANDMMSFARALTSENVFPKAVLSKFNSSAEELGYFPQPYGFGQFILRDAASNGAYARHGGFDYGFNSVFLRHLRQPFAVFAASAASEPEIEVAADRVFRSLCGELLPTHAVVPAHRASSLTTRPELRPGCYRSKLGDDVRVIEKVGDNRFRLKWMQGFDLRPSATCWILDGTPWELRQAMDGTSITLENTVSGQQDQLDILPSQRSWEMPIDALFLNREHQAILRLTGGTSPNVKLSFAKGCEHTATAVSENLLVWDGGFWAEIYREAGEVVKLIVNHPRCLKVVFSRVSDVAGYQ